CVRDSSAWSAGFDVW
nr:immunoglobulin heavy chain junction region [Macaca mulatta]